jgi:hypothetical protein
MLTLNGSDGSKFIINELENSPYEIHKVQISEGCWGALPKIEVLFKYKVLPVTLNQILTGSITTLKGYKIKFNGYVHTCTFHKDEGSFTIICVDKNFINNKFTTYYSNIDSAINSTWKRSRLDNIKSDIVSFKSPWKLYQMDETNYHFCSRCCQSYLHKTVYSYRFAGLKFTNLRNWKAETVINDRAEAEIISTNTWEVPRTYEQDVTSDNPNSDIVEFEKDPNHVYVRCDEGLIPVSSAYRDLIGNYLYNQRLVDTPHQTSWRLRYMSEIQCGDMIKINSKFVNYNECYVQSRTITYDHADVSEVLITKSINP